MTDPNTQSALTPKFGDVIENGWASEENPTRRGFFVRKGRRTGKLNAGTYFEVTDGNGKFWELPLDKDHKITVRAHPPATGSLACVCIGASGPNPDCGRCGGSGDAGPPATGSGEAVAWRDLGAEEQYALAQQIAANVGYQLVAEGAAPVAGRGDREAVESVVRAAVTAAYSAGRRQVSDAADERDRIVQNAVSKIAALSAPTQESKVGPWRIWFDPPPIGTRNCDWHYQHEDCDGPESPAWMTGSCASREECVVAIVEQMDDLLAQAAIKAHQQTESLKSDVVAFCGVWAAQWAKDHGLPEGQLHHQHYDILAAAGARLDRFTRSPEV